MMLEITKFYLNTPMVRYKYVRNKIEDILEEIIVEYKLHDKYQVTAMFMSRSRKGCMVCHRQEYSCRNY
jgi:hypothetical protein